MRTGLQWGTATMLDSVLRLMQFHVQLDEDDAGVLYSRVPYIYIYIHIYIYVYVYVYMFI